MPDCIACGSSHNVKVTCDDARESRRRAQEIQTMFLLPHFKAAPKPQPEVRDAEVK